MKIDEDAQVFVGCGIFLLLAAIALVVIAYAWRMIA